MLTTYNGQPAIFTTDPVPGDAKLPYIVTAGHVADTPWDTATGVGREILRDIRCYVDATGSMAQIENIAERVRQLFNWQRIQVEGYETVIATCTGPIIGETDGESFGLIITVRLFVLEWPSSITYEPDPIAALNNWTSTISWEPIVTAPEVYWKLIRLTPAEITAAVSWIQAQITAYILSPDLSIRTQYVRKLTEALSQQRRINLSDGSPLEFMTVSADSEADPMRQGQVQLTARFGVLTPVATVPVLNRAIVSGATTGEVT